MYRTSETPIEWISPSCSWRLTLPKVILPWYMGWKMAVNAIVADSALRLRAFIDDRGSAAITELSVVYTSATVALERAMAWNPPVSGLMTGRWRCPTSPQSSVGRASCPRTPVAQPLLRHILG